MHPKGAKRNKLAHAIFSKAGPNLIKPEETKIPRQTPNMCKFKSKRIKIRPNLKIDTPKSGIASTDTGINPISALKIAVKVIAVIISLIFSGVINKLVKFLLHISSKNIIL